MPFGNSKKALDIFKSEFYSNLSICNFSHNNLYQGGVFCSVKYWAFHRALNFEKAFSFNPKESHLSILQQTFSLGVEISFFFLFA